MKITIMNFINDVIVPYSLPVIAPTIGQLIKKTLRCMHAGGENGAFQSVYAGGLFHNSVPNVYYYSR